jgi:hypothetical protein
LRTGLPDAGRSVGPDLADACAIHGTSRRHSSFH